MPFDPTPFRVEISRAFTPNAPIGRRDLFSGRSLQIQAVLDTIFQSGQHAVIYGERGVGKTSLANVLSDWLNFLQNHNYQLVRVNCAAQSTFDSIFRSALRELTVRQKMSQAGFLAKEAFVAASLDEFLPQNCNPEDVRFALQQVGTSTIIVIDEFDRVSDRDVSRMLADTIKSLSDHAVTATLLVIGVADSIEQLIAEHRSIERAIAQIQMPRMSRLELGEIISKGLSEAGMTVQQDAQTRVTTLSQGLPSHTHTLAKFAALNAISNESLEITADDVAVAIQNTVSQAQQTILSQYHRAITSPHQNLYKEVLLAAALAKNDDLGWFSPGDLRDPLLHITKKAYTIDRYLKHLNDFCSLSRGPVLDKAGQKKRPLYRFKDSMLEPFVIMKGIRDGLVTTDLVIEIED